MLASVAACKNSCAHVTADHELSVKTFAEELKTLTDAAQILRCGHAYLLFQVSSFNGVHLTVDLKVFDAETMMRRHTQNDHSAVLSQLASRLIADTRCGSGTGEDPFAKVKKVIMDLIDKLRSEVSSEANEESAKARQKKGDVLF